MQERAKPTLHAFFVRVRLLVAAVSFTPFSFTAVSLVGCVTTRVALEPSSPQKYFASRAATRAERPAHQLPRPRQLVRPLRFTVVHPEAPLVVGRQFALLALPLGRIEAERPGPDLERRLVERAAVRGIVAEATPLGAASVFVATLDELRLDAYDLLVVRRLSCTLHGTLRRPGREPVSIETTVSEWRRYGFEPELEGLLRDCMGSFSDRLLDEAARGGRIGSALR